MAFRQFAFLGDDAQFLLSRKGLLAQPVPTLVEFSSILICPLLRNVMGSMHRAGSVIDKERFVGGQCLLLANPLDGLARHVICEMIALLRLLLWLNGRRSFPDRRKVLIRLASDKAIEVFKPAAAGGPGIERTDRTGLPHRNIVTLAELRCGVAIELEGSGNRRRSVG